MAGKKAKAAAKPLAGVAPQPFQLTTAELKKSIVHHLRTTLGTDEAKANHKAWWNATCAAVNEMVFERLTETQKTHAKNDTRAVHYLSLEFLMGRLLSNNLHNLNLFEKAEEAGLLKTKPVEEEKRALNLLVRLSSKKRRA